MILGPLDIFRGCFITMLCGLSLAWIFDSLNLFIVELEDNKKSTLTVILDFISALIYSLYLILALYYLADGTFRGLWILSTFLGVYFYHKFLAKYFRKLSRIILVPLIFPLRIIIKIIRKIRDFLLHTIEKLEFKLYNKYEY